MRAKVCDFCEVDCENVYYDGKTRLGPWAIMCSNCWPMYKIGLGTGLGQRFELQGKDWVKTHG